MQKRSRAGVPTSRFSKSFLASSWAKRNEMNDSERRGFAQFLYLTICGHIESLLASTICARLKMISWLRWEAVPPMVWKVNDTEKVISLDPVFASVVQIADRMQDEATSAPLSKLIEIFGRVFPQSLKNVLGNELYEQLTALADLRNLFAHGREMTMEFDSSPDFAAFKGTLDGNPLQRPILCLRKSGIIGDLEIDGINYAEFLYVFYSDAAIRHFHEAVEAIEERLGASGTIEPERALVHAPPLEPLGE